MEPQGVTPTNNTYNRTLKFKRKIEWYDSAKHKHKRDNSTRDAQFSTPSGKSETLLSKLGENNPRSMGFPFNSGGGDRLHCTSVADSCPLPTSLGRRGKRVIKQGDRLVNTKGSHSRALNQSRNRVRVSLEHVSGPEKRRESTTSHKFKKIEPVCGHPPLQDGRDTHSKGSNPAE